MTPSSPTAAHIAACPVRRFRTTGRTVRSKWWRIQLEQDAGGRCYLCGGALGDDWEPDHVHAWSRGGETVPSNIRAACRPCNQRKGAMQFRGFQQWLHTMFTDVLAGDRPCPSEIVLDAGCGGGKSVAALIIAYWLIERLRVVDRVLWVVPNASLRKQAAEACAQDEVAAKLLGHHIEIMEATNSGNPAKGTQGYVITYAAAAAARLRGSGLSNPHVEEMSKYRYALILDEPHHMTTVSGDSTERAYARGIEPLIALAKVRVFMSGTLYRHDRKPIAFMAYDNDGRVSDLETDDRWFHRYTLRDAIRDEAVIQTEFYLSEGKASWARAGQPFRAESIKEDPAALWSALHTEFADEVLTDCVRHWQGWRTHHRRSKLLVVCSNVQQARRAVKLLSRLGVRAEIATYAEENADDRIDWFKQSKVDALVTVMKAYEGLDVKDITHLACLTHIRSLQWIQQAIARAWRFDWKGEPYAQQRAFVFAPADTLFKQIVDWIWQAFQHRVIEERDSVRDGSRASGDPENVPGVVTPEGSEKTDTDLKLLGGDDWKRDAAQNILRIQEELIARGLPPTPIDHLAAIIEIMQASADEPVAASPKANGSAYRTPGERLQLMKDDLKNNVGVAAGLLARETGLSVGECAADINTQIKKRWRQRGEMEEDEVRDAISWVRQHYGIE